MNNEVDTYRDLNDPEGWRFSSLRKTLLLRFRNLFSERVEVKFG